MDQPDDRPTSLADRLVIVLDDEAFDELLRILDRPARRIPSLIDLFERPSPFGSQQPTRPEALAHCHVAERPEFEKFGDLRQLWGGFVR